MAGLVAKAALSAPVAEISAPPISRWEGEIRPASACPNSRATPIVSAIGHEKDAPLLDYVADWRASTPTDAGKKVVPDMAEELALITQLRNRAVRTISGRIEMELSKIQSLRERPVMQSPEVMNSSRREIIDALWVRSFRTTAHRIALAYEEISSLRTAVRTLSPQSTLDRGYSVIQKSDGSLVRSASQITSGEKVRMRFAEGEANAITE